MNIVQYIIYGEGKDGIPLYLPVVSREAGEEIIPMLGGIKNAKVVSIEYVPQTKPSVIP
jgi:hypothetical protein